MGFVGKIAKTTENPAIKYKSLKHSCLYLVFHRFSILFIDLITIHEVLPDNVASIWMSEPELVELFGVIAPTLRASIRTIYKSGVLKKYEVQKYIRLDNGYHADVFSFPMVVALAFRINTFGAEQVRNAILERVYLRKEKINIFFSLGVNSMEISKYQA